MKESGGSAGSCGRLAILLLVGAVLPAHAQLARTAAPRTPENKAMQVNFEALKFDTLAHVGFVAPNAAPGRSLSSGARMYEYLKHLIHPHAHGKCGPNKHFPLDPHEIPVLLLAMLDQEVMQVWKQFSHLTRHPHPHPHPAHPSTPLRPLYPTTQPLCFTPAAQRVQRLSRGRNRRVGGAGRSM